MNKNIKLSTVLLAALTFTACSNSSSNNNNTPTNTGGNNSNQSNGSAYVSNSTKCTGGDEVVQGYKLPPCPDEKENAKTLLGIDTNDNGVRDDVEVWIYHTYDTHKNCKKTTEIRNELIDGNNVTYGVIHNDCTDEEVPYHQVVREIAMQYAKAYQVVIQDPSKARENVELVHNAVHCESYFSYEAKYNNSTTIPDDYDLYKELDNVQFNTVQRARAYHQYNFNLGGGVYGSPKGSYRDLCDFDVKKLLGE